VGFVRDLERTIMGVCAAVGVRTVPVEGRSGVWVVPEGEDARKVCAIGMRVSKRATMHGVALNCANDLSWAHSVIPCGSDGAGVTSLRREAGQRRCVADVVDVA